MIIYKNNLTNKSVYLYLCTPPKVLGRHYEEECIYTGERKVIKNFNIDNYTVISEK